MKIPDKFSQVLDAKHMLGMSCFGLIIPYYVWAPKGLGNSIPEFCYL